MKASFKVERFCIVIKSGGSSVCAAATVKVLVDGQGQLAVAEADGPMSALGQAMGLALQHFYPNLNLAGDSNDGWLNAICGHLSRLSANYGRQI